MQISWHAVTFVVLYVSSNKQQSAAAQRTQTPNERRPQNYPFRYVACPLGHVTQEFLACDVRSSCWSDDASTTQAWGSPWRGMCESRTNLPPSFTCTDGVTHVPYSLVCNYRDDCHDSSDETFCTFPACLGQRPLQCGASSQVERGDG